jgi:hypothetical protein
MANSACNVYTELQDRRLVMCDVSGANESIFQHPLLRFCGYVCLASGVVAISVAV